MAIWQLQLCLLFNLHKKSFLQFCAKFSQAFVPFLIWQTYFHLPIFLLFAIRKKVHSYLWWRIEYWARVCKLLWRPGVDSARLGIDSGLLKRFTNTGSEPVFVNVYEAQESIPGLLKRFTNTGSNYWACRGIKVMPWEKHRQDGDPDISRQTAAAVPHRQEEPQTLFKRRSHDGYF